MYQRLDRMNRNFNSKTLIIIAFLLVLFVGYRYVLNDRPLMSDLVGTESLVVTKIRVSQITTTTSRSTTTPFDGWTFRSKWDGSNDYPAVKGIFADQFKANHFWEGPIDKETLLENANDLVYRYVSLPLDFGMGSGAIPLAVCGMITNGDILELGMGLYSTNVLHKIGELSILLL